MPKRELFLLLMQEKSRDEKMAKKTLENKVGEAVLRIEDRVTKIYKILTDVGAKITHVLEHKDYRTLPYTDPFYETA